MALNENGRSLGTQHRAAAAKVLAGALANGRVARSLISALGTHSFSSILATSTSQVTDFGGLLTGDLVIHMPANGLPAGSPALGTAATYGVLAKSAISTVNPTTVNGDLGISPNNLSSVTGSFTVSGASHGGDAAAAQAQADAAAAYTALAANGGYVTIPNVLDAQSLTAGYYTFGAGDVSLAGSANGTLTLTGSASDIFVFKTPSTLSTGAGGMPTISLVGVLPSNVYWVIGSSATLNIGVTSAGGVFPGTVLAAVSITVTQEAVINGRLLATTASGAAISFSDFATVNVVAGAGAGTSFSVIAVDGNLGFPAVIGDMYLGLHRIDLDANNPLIPPAPAGHNARETGDGGTRF